MLDAKLVVVGGDAKAAEVRLKLPTVIGRGKEASLTVPHGLVSRRHTEIFEKSGRLFVRDLGSLNGTYINNVRIEGEQPLQPNQLLTLGNITFRAVYEVESDTITSDTELTTSNTTAAAAKSESDVVAFEEVEAKDPKVSLTEVVTFDETVPLSSIQSAQKNRELADADAEVEVFEPAAEKTSSSDTDKSFVGETKSDGSMIDFSIEQEEVDPASKSILGSALEDLPTGQAAVSFVGGVDLGDDKKPISQIDPVEIDLGAESSADKVDQDSSLGSFLKKLPR